MGEPIFFGTKKDQQQYFKSKNLKEQVEEKKEEAKEDDNKDSVSERMFLDMETLGPLPDDIRKILDTTRLRNDPLTVFMQSDLEFYDNFYMEEVDEDDELTVAARSIRRTYKNYPDYSYACRVRDKYIDRLFYDTYEGNEIKFQAALRANDGPWIPPMPIYSTRSSDYKAYKLGLYSLDMIKDVDVDRAKEIFDQIEPVDDVGVIFDVMTNLSIIDKLNDSDGKNDVIDRTYRAVTSTDIKNFQEIVRSWYTEDTDKKPIDERVFCRTEDKLREQFYDQFKVDLREFRDRIGPDGIIEEPEDMNELVYDPKTGKPMSNAEYKKRLMVRWLASQGWSELPLMRVLQVGSERERLELEGKESRAKKNKLKASAVMDRELDNIQGTEYVPAYDESYDVISAFSQMFGGGV